MSASHFVGLIAEINLNQDTI